MRPPAVSIGIVPFSRRGERLEFLMVRRRNTVGFMDLVRGKYEPEHPEHVARLVDVMTMDEKEAIASWDFAALWEKAWGRGYQGDTVPGHTSLAALRRGVSVRGTLVTIAGLIAGSPTTWTEPEWEFPKGRKHALEKDSECASRECAEETGLPPSAFEMVSNAVPLEEVFTGSNLRSYKYKYYLAYVANTTYPLDSFQRSEIGAVAWMTPEDCVTAVRPYHAERRELITDLAATIQRLRLFSA